ncbi:hypothetical protein [Dactylosporangium matsuzakiense]|uniref:Uncharacterized protein n=1 Tax=Dactylosporangium matsuzakiense TaxID=53360 RepID=A0A9W6NTU0_9ACTN|nr:hypothetical protein [Dactylosporangium matsuzakiense]UWZ47818.1 hypothetical protein Dmats_16275 [Dactylosporangium matsuzakiense]GLL08756.1 hypothetical protein GCM10017581_105270 [Dactylosporangium matsuzakiense]
MTADVHASATDRATPRVPLFNRLVLRRLTGRTGDAEALTALRYTARDGRTVTLPVMAAHDRQRITVLVGKAETKQWWRHFRTPAPVEVWIGGQWRTGLARVCVDAAAVAAYHRRFPRARTGASPTFVTIMLDAAPDPVPALRGRDLSQAWFRAVTVAEFAGFAVPATVAALTAQVATPVAVGALLAAGAVEGAALGWGQVRVLRRALPAIAARRWIAATSLAAVIAYALGLAPSTFANTLQAWPPVWTAAAGLVAGVALLATIGTAQWAILRRHVAQAWRWIITTALAWLAGLTVFLAFAMPLWQPGQPAALVIGIGIVGGLLMAATTAGCTGIALRRLLAR